MNLGLLWSMGERMEQGLSAASHIRRSNTLLRHQSTAIPRQTKAVARQYAEAVGRNRRYRKSLFPELAPDQQLDLGTGDEFGKHSRVTRFLQYDSRKADIKQQ
jgi:hypothetical protein